MSDTNTNEQKTVGYNGLERYDNKIKTYIQDKIDSSGTSGSIAVDDTLSSTSENPVQNKVIKAELDKKGTYSKPTDGIPKTDLASAVQTSLGKADNSLPLSGGAMTGNIGYKGTKATIPAIKFIDNTADANGNGISIGSGGLTIIGGGESSGVMTNQFGSGQYGGGTEKMIIANDAEIDFYSNCQDGFDKASHITMNKDGSITAGGFNGNATSATTVNGHTVNSDVPENAKFTDTTYELATSSTDGLMSSTDKAILDKRLAYKLVSSSFQTVSIDVSDWNTLSSGGYACEKTLPVGLLYDNYIFDVSLSSDIDAAKLQLQSWNYIMADGRIEQSTISVNGEKTTSFTFYAFTTKPTVALTVAIQGVSGS